MIRSVTGFGLGCMVVLGCAVRPAPEDATGSSGSGITGGGEGGVSSGVPTTGGAGGTTTPSATSTSDATSSTTDTGSTGVVTCGFLCGTSDNEVTPPCDVFKQNCPEGEKCSAYAEGGSSWNASKCVPVQGDGQAGEPCTAEGMGRSGLDDCAKGVMCWEVDDMDHGTCVELCTGNGAAPTCSDEENFNCACTGECVLNLCLPACDPLVQGCADGHLCLPIGETFVCVLDGSGEEGQTFDPCEFANGCDKGLLCLNPSAATECDANAGGCCMPFCDVTDPDFVCPGVGIECVSLYEEGMAPPEFAKVGICVIPG